LAANVYDCLLILDSNRYSRDAAGAAGQIKALIEAQGGEVLVNRLWEERRLAYSIRGQRKGTYWLSYFRMEGKGIAKLEREFQLSELVLRSLVLKVDPQISDALVAHAAGATRANDAKPAGEAKPAPAAAALAEEEGA
jgi:small subunit ribosomal protein S6